MNSEFNTYCTLTIIATVFAHLLKQHQLSIVLYTNDNSYLASIHRVRIVHYNDNSYHIEYIRIVH